ncbi:WD repeat-containing protein 18 [Varanus komodoensis]|nr:WD repeat-containing protein 18 [Varanus komodoensis]
MGPRLWEISSGNLLLSVVFEVSIMSVTLDLTEYYMFCGGMDGSIFQVELFSWAGRGFQPEPDNGKIFKGHKNQVSCLSTSTDGTLLLSGSHDETVRLWHIQSRQCVRTVTYKGPITNVLITMAPANMLIPESKPKVPLPKFSRHLHSVESIENPASDGLTICLGLPQKVPVPTAVPEKNSTAQQRRESHGLPRARCSRIRSASLLTVALFDLPQGSGESYLEKAERMYAQMCSTKEKNMMGDQEQLKIQVAELEEEVSTLRKINKSLFDFSNRIITKPGK